MSLEALAHESCLYEDDSSGSRRRSRTVLCKEATAETAMRVFSYVAEGVAKLGQIFGPTPKSPERAGLRSPPVTLPDA